MADNTEWFEALTVEEAKEERIILGLWFGRVLSRRRKTVNDAPALSWRRRRLEHKQLLTLTAWGAPYARD
jgi:hypothetical protein